MRLHDSAHRAIVHSPGGPVRGVPSREPPEPLARRRVADLDDGRLRCVLGHHLRLHAHLMAWDGYTCDHVRPRTRRSCGVGALYVRGAGPRVLAVEATREELLFIRDMAMTPALALAWLGATVPLGFVPRF